MNIQYFTIILHGRLLLCKVVEKQPSQYAILAFLLRSCDVA